MKILRVKDYTGGIINNLIQKVYSGKYSGKYSDRVITIHEEREINYKEKHRIKLSITNYKNKSPR